MTVGLSETEVVVRLALGFALGALVGLERETHDRPAGLRTFILVCVGSTLIMIVSTSLREIFPDAAGIDPGRIAAQVVTGIGFLGAGTIIHQGPFIRGLTTAAGLWVVAAIGLAIGAGLYFAAAATTFLALITLNLLARVERAHIGAKGFAVVKVTAGDQPGQLGRIASALGERGIDIRDVSLAPREGGLVVIELRVKLTDWGALDKALSAVLKLPGFQKAEYSS